MNAIVETRAPGRSGPVAAPHPTHTYKLLLKREFWEHKGGFFWAPLVAGGISLLLTMMAIVVGEVAMRKAAKAGELNIEGVQVNGLDLGMLTQKLGPEEMRHLAGGIDLSLFLAASWPLIVLAFVVFFYCLGALYDERKDRSVLFWKSLPVSDRDTVLSKAASALVVAPVLAIGAALATMIGFMVIISVVVMLHGGNPVQLLWGPGSPLAVAGQFIAAIPVYALWALPTVGWLLLCSAWARSKPFLWAIMIPVFAGLFVTWFDLMQVFNLDTTWFWKNIVARLLTSVFPGSWLDVAHLEGMDFDGPGQIRNLISLQSMYSTVLTPQLWAGVVAGAAMILGAIRLRRWRDDN
ncbi:MAG: ABC-2 transporter permease [Gammaproteobacteria bacterium]|nr:ABC-2 transporter permease [Gammaproteobacteria bacterium]